MDREALLRDHAQGLSRNKLAKAHYASKASICEVLKEAPAEGGHKSLRNPSASP